MILHVQRTLASTHPKLWPVWVNEAKRQVAKGLHRLQLVESLLPAMTPFQGGDAVAVGDFIQAPPRSTNGLAN